jgi:hypothetical protein
MQALNSHSAGPAFQFPIEELESIESIIVKSRQWLETLEHRRSMLTSELDRITSPAPKLDVPTHAKPLGMGLMYKGEWIADRKYIDIHVGLLRKLWVDFPDRRCDMARAMGRFGTSRSYVATSIADLFPHARPSWARRFSRRLVDEWYVDTNLNPERMQKILPAAIEVSGLKFGVDVAINWR